MTFNDLRKFQTLTQFDNLRDYLRDELGWPIEVEDLDEATFEYSAQELNINPRYAARITSIKQLRPLVDNQLWGIFFVEFDNNRLPVMALRRILQSLAVSRRKMDASRRAWNRDDLLFICVYTSAAEGTVGQRGITFAHFREEKGKQPELRSFSWDSRETHFYYIRNLNLNGLRWPTNDRDVEVWRDQWRGAFTIQHRYTIRTSEKLASQMAKQAVVIRELVEDLYDAEGENGALHVLYQRLLHDLMHDLQPDDFADMIAQTITYGAFSAAVQNQREQPPREFSLDKLAEFIPDTNSFLKRMLETLTTSGKLNLDELGVGALVELLRQIDLQSITRDFGRQTGSGSEDPVVHFYEQFLNEYDRQQRVQRGVFYTPDPVVEYIVNAVDQILQRPVEVGGFGIKDGIASDATVAIKDKHGKDTEETQPLVQILDPATGTGTFLAHIIDHIARKKNPRGQPTDTWNSYVANNLLKRLNGFELMMAPYTIAHLKLGLKLAQTGYTFGTGERLRVFLTNALEKPVAMSDVLLETDYLSREANEASIVKRTKPIMVVIGNPPYSGNSANQIPEDWFKLNDYYFVDGKPLGERNPKMLQDDYVKFIRFGQRRIEETGEGVLAFITNHGYLDNPTFRGMRQQLMSVFNEIYILDLHGNSRKHETTPDGEKDENVFDIMQGVAIGIFIKRRRSSSEEKPPARVSHRHIWGLRESKYSWLTTNAGTWTIDDDWSKLQPITPFYLYIPQSHTAEVATEYEQAWKVTDFFPTHSVNIRTHRDQFVVDFDRDALLTRIDDLRSAGLSDNEAQERYDLKNTSDWGLSTARAKLKADQNYLEKIRKCHYRPFDERWIFYSDYMIDRPATDVVGQYRFPNLGFSTTRQATSVGFEHILANRYVTEYKFVSHDRNTSSFPLYLYHDPNKSDVLSAEDFPLSEKGRRPNLSKTFVEQFGSKLGLEFVTDGRGDLVNTFGPEDVFHYAYAIFHSRLYRERYAEQLKIDFPRLPLTTDVELFRKLVTRGVDLVALHLLEDEYEGTDWKRHGQSAPTSIEKGKDRVGEIIRFVGGKNGSTVGAMSKSRAYDETLKRIYLDTSDLKTGSYFEFVEGISPEEANETWEFQVGGYQVLHKWLSDRGGSKGEPGRTLTEDELKHYQRVVAALYHTRKLMDDIDEVIEEHGGFPLKGSGSNDTNNDELESDEMNDFPKTPKDLFGPVSNQRAFGDLENDENEPLLNGDEPIPQELTTEVFDRSIARTTGVEDEPEDPNLQPVQDIQPFDPAQIRIETRPMSLDVILKRMKHSEINLQPDFQRMGGIWDRLKMSRLIESLLIRIPLPAFYMDATDENQWLVIDGLQRLTTLKRFIMPDKPQDQLKLYKMEFWKEFEGYTYEMLPRHLQRRIEETQVTVYLVEKGTPHNVKFNIFKRINTGGVPLSGQEIRHALNLGTATELIKELAESQAFKTATDNGVSPIRMTDRECVLRFLAFSMRSPSEYSSKDELDSFLNTRMKEINELGKNNPQEIEILRARFKRAMQAAQRILGNKAFRKPSKNNRRSPVSKALFEVWSVNLEKLTDDQLNLLFHRRKMLEKKFIGLMKDIEFDTAISYSTGDARRVQYRFSKIAQIIEETLNNA